MNVATTIPYNELGEQPIMDEGVIAYPRDVAVFVEGGRDVVVEYVITLKGTARRHDIEHQIDELMKLEAGWLDGEGEKPSERGLNWLRDKLLDNYTVSAPELHLYPTEDGNVMAEWWIGTHDVTLEIDLSSHTGYWHDYDSSSEQSNEREIDCNEKTCWIWIIRTLRDLR